MTNENKIGKQTTTQGIKLILDGSQERKDKKYKLLNEADERIQKILEGAPILVLAIFPAISLRGFMVENKNWLISRFVCRIIGSLIEKIILGIPDFCAQKRAPSTEEDPILTTNTSSSFFLGPEKISIA